MVWAGVPPQPLQEDHGNRRYQHPNARRFGSCSCRQAILGVGKHIDSVSASIGYVTVRAESGKVARGGKSTAKTILCKEKRELVGVSDRRGDRLTDGVICLHGAVRPANALWLGASTARCYSSAEKSAVLVGVNPADWR